MPIKPQNMKKYLFIPCLILFGLGVFGQKRIAPSSIVTGTFVGISPAVRDIPDWQPGMGVPAREFGENDHANIPIGHNVYNPNAISTDGAIQRTVNSKGGLAQAAPTITFDGKVSSQGYLPPDICQSTGPNHVVQMTNTLMNIYSKTGTLLVGNKTFSSIATGATNDGDPVVLYDQQADRWLLMQFSDVGSATQAGLYFCISTTPDPTGTYYVYHFITNPGTFPDYPHIGIWNNCYTVTGHEFSVPAGAWVGQAYYAVPRATMLAGPGSSALTLVRFSVGGDGGMLPASFEGNKTPDLTSTPSFWGWGSDEGGYTTDRLIYRSMYVDFSNPTSSYLSEAIDLTTSSFDGSVPATLAGTSYRNAIEEPGTGTGYLLDAIADRMMSRVIYRRFDDHESLVMNHTVNISGQAPTAANKYQAAVRWYELRRTLPTDPWTIYQQGTYAPNPISGTGINEWMASIGIDQRGNIGIGYSRSGPTATGAFPSIYYATRCAADPLGTLGAEQVFYASTASQNSTSFRWGDYTAMCTAPDGDTLWYTNEYYNATGTTWRTRIGAFVITPCAAAAPTVHFKTGGIYAPQASAVLVPGSTCVHYKDYPTSIVIEAAPSSAATVTLTTSGNAVLGVDYDLIYTSPITLSGASMTFPITVRVYDAKQNAPDRYAYIGYTLSGGNATADTYNQKLQVTIPAVAFNLAAYTTKTYGAAASVYNETFESYTAGAISGNWTESTVFLTAGGVNVNHFVFGTAAALMTTKSMYVSDNGSAYSYTQTVTAGVPYTITKIRASSPNINITGKGQVTATFDWEANGEESAAIGGYWDYGSFWYSMDGGATWATDGTILVNTTAKGTKTISLPANFENVANLKIAFQWENDDNGGTVPPLAVDNIDVKAKPIVCSAPKIQSATDAGTAPTTDLAPNQSVYYADGTTTNLLTNINNTSSFDFGCTKVEVDRSGTGAVAFNDNVTSHYLASKTFKVTPSNNSGASSYTVSLYYTEAEVAGWEAATGQSRTNLKVVKVDAAPISAVTPATQGSYTYVVAPATQVAYCTGGLTYTATFTGTASPVEGFGIGNPLQTVPVTLLQFRGENIKGQGNKLIWVVTNQFNMKQYELQFSTDGNTFTTIATVGPRPFAGSNLSYDHMHHNYINGNNYYRLKSVDLDGRISYSTIVVINVRENGSVVIYPNPVVDNLLVNYRGVNSTIQIDIMDAVGQVVYTNKMAVANPISIPVSKMASGNYVLRITDGSNILNTKFVKQ
jgi:hypothetical protein